jgi:hypothetical protein
MPAVTTHIECAKDIYDSLPLGKQIVINNKNMFFLGAQGPDLFYFYKLGVPSRLNQIGNYLHNNQIYNVIKYMDEYVKRSGNYNLLNYYYGYLCHYALDSEVHPLVFQRSRYGNLGDEPELVIHYRIEAFIDKYMLNKKNRTIKSFDAHKLIQISKEEREQLAKMYVSLFKDVLGLTVEQEKIEKSCRDMVRALIILKPNSKIKYNAIQNYETLSGKDHTISSLMLYNDFDNVDYVLNNDRHEFVNIDDDSLVYNDSFDDLYEKAIKKAVKLITEPLAKENFKLNFRGSISE